tara:strand:- start:340 stop:1215 length:876 start_codon:yes stop_codon:yes gene_type:complete
MSDCTTIEERGFAEYQMVRIPAPKVVNEFAEPFRCCDEKQLVLAHSSETESYKNDISSAWIKLSSATDTITFELTKNDVTTTYNPVERLFPNEPFAWYCTILWKDVLASDGIGCYKLKLNYSIGGIVGSITWANYELKEYSLSTAKYTARLRVKFNLNQAIEGIDFTNSNVEDTLRFNGFIGERQPNMEIDNLIYQDRTIKSVIRENLNTFQIKTDPYTNGIIDLLTDLYLLSENELYISDYNSFNNSHNILDLPVIVQESPEIDYLVEYQRKAVLTCVVGDKSQDKRTFY